MVVTVDGRAVERVVSPGCTLQELIDELLQTELEGRLVISVAMDGRQLGDQELNARLGESVPTGVQLELGSSTPTQLVAGVLESLSVGFAEAADAFPGVADRLAGDEAPAAIHDVGRSLAAWQTCYRALAQCGSLLQRDLLEDCCGDRPMGEHLDELSGRLNALRGALESRDTVLLADLVRYELPPLARKWQDLLVGMARQLNAECPTEAGEHPANHKRAR